MHNYTHTSDGQDWKAAVSENLYVASRDQPDAGRNGKNTEMAAFLWRDTDYIQMYKSGDAKPHRVSIW